MAAFALRRVLHTVIRFALLHKIVVAVMVVLAIGFLALGAGRLSQLSGSNNVQAFSTRAATGDIERAEPVAPAPATQQYLRGSQEFNAQLMWDSLSDDVKAAAQTQGQGLQSLQAKLDQTKAGGGEVKEVRYVGGYVPDSGDSMYFYVMTMVNPAVSPQPQHVYYVFIVGEDGKIKEIG